MRPLASYLGKILPTGQCLAVRILLDLTRSHKARFLWMTSFSAFLMVFTSAMKSGDINDSTLLEEVAQMLHGFRHASYEMGRLHDTCTSFARLAASYTRSEDAGQTFSMEDQALAGFADTSFQDAEMLRELFGSEFFSQSR